MSLVLIGTKHVQFEHTASERMQYDTVCFKGVAHMWHMDN